MDFKTFIAEIIDSLAWPITLVALVWILRKQLGAAIKKITKVKHKDTEVTFASALSEAKELSPDATDEKITKESIMLAEQSPRGAVLEAWLRVEKELKNYALRHNFQINEKLPPSRLIRELQFNSIESNHGLGAGIYSMLERLRETRNAAVHLSDSRITSDEALDYVSLANRVIERIEEA